MWNIPRPRKCDRGLDLDVRLEFPFMSQQRNCTAITAATLGCEAASGGWMHRVLVVTIAVLVSVLVGAASVGGVTYWVLARRFVAGDLHALDGIVTAPVNEPLVFLHTCGFPHDRRTREDPHSGLDRHSRPSDAHWGPDLLTRAPQLMDDWLAIIRQYPQSRAPIVRRGQLKLKAGVTTMRILGDGYYSPAYRDELARWDVVGPRVLSFDEIDRRIEEHIAHGVDVIKIATEHLVHVPHELPDDLIQAIKARGIAVCPTLSGSAYSVWKFLQAPELLYEGPDLVANVPVGVRKDLYFTVRVLKLPGVARLLLRQPEPMRQWERWYEHSLRNTKKLYRAGVPLIFGTDTPFAFGNFFHLVMNEVRALRLAGLPNEAILRMATSCLSRSRQAASAAASCCLPWGRCSTFSRGVPLMIAPQFPWSASWPAASSPFTSRTPASSTRATAHIRRRRGEVP
jgi:hypothetical protein